MEFEPKDNASISPRAYRVFYAQLGGPYVSLLTLREFGELAPRPYAGRRSPGPRVAPISQRARGVFDGEG